MRDVTLLDIFDHRITQKYLNRSGLAHAIAVAYHAFNLAREQGEDADAEPRQVCCMIWGILHGTGMENGIMTSIARMIFILLKVRSVHINY